MMPLAEERGAGGSSPSPLKPAAGTRERAVPGVHVALYAVKVSVFACALCWGYCSVVWRMFPASGSVQETRTRLSQRAAVAQAAVGPVGLLPLPHFPPAPRPSFDKLAVDGAEGHSGAPNRNSHHGARPSFDLHEQPRQEDNPSTTDGDDLPLDYFDCFLAQMSAGDSEGASFSHLPRATPPGFFSR